MIIQRETNMTPGISESIFSRLSFVGDTMPPRTPTMTRMKRMRKTAATRTTTASRPLFENLTKISPASHSKNGRCPKRRVANPRGGTAPIRCVCENVNRSC